ncbi:MAG: glycosyltransferase [bacterium]|nr:glycosyltransferase [bacterium]
MIVLHFYATGPGQELAWWLGEERKEEVVLIEHPFPFAPRKVAVVQEWSGGKTMKRWELGRGGWPLFVRYGLDFVRTLLIVLKMGGRFDLYVGNGGFDTMPGIILRWVGRVRKVVLYSIDYAPYAGGTRLYAWLYRRIDQWCCYRVDRIWNLSRRMQRARVIDGLREGRSAVEVWVPHGAHVRALRARLPQQTDCERIVFMGHVQEKSGIQLLLEVLPRLVRRHPGVRLDIVGGGPYLPVVRARVAEEGLAERVCIHGYVEDHRKVEEILMGCGIGVALYRPDPTDFSVYADPGKPKVYLACGLPVVIVRIPEVAEEIERRGAGKAIRYDAEELEAALEEIMGRHGEYRARALAMAEDYEWGAIFERALQETGFDKEKDGRQDEREQGQTDGGRLR